MASHLDLEEQEQIDQLKHFWNTWGMLISSILIAAFLGIGSWNGYQFWKSRQSLQATALFDAVESSALSGDQERLNQSFFDLQVKYPNTIQATQAGFVIAKSEIEKNHIPAASSALEWIAENSSDDGYKAIANLRLASLLIEQKSYENALKHLTNNFPAGFEGVVADRKGDLLNQQGKKQEAVEEYQRAYKIFGPNTEYQRLVEVKLNSLGVQNNIPSTSNVIGVVN